MNRRKWDPFKNSPRSLEHAYEVPFRPESAAIARGIQLSYRTAITRYKKLYWAEAFPWFTWLIALTTTAIWCLTAYQVALADRAQTLHDILTNVLSNSQDADVLITYGAKYNQAILVGQYWRFITPIFLHANILHISLNMLNLIVLGIFVERIFGHLYFLLIYLVTGVISIIASFYFAPQEISVGASGAIFGLVGAYSLFIFTHRRAFPAGGIPALSWLVLMIGINLGIGLIIPNVDNYAHVGGLLSGCILGWLFAPYYVARIKEGKTELINTHSLTCRWPLALISIVTTLFCAVIALHFIGG